MHRPALGLFCALALAPAVRAGSPDPASLAIPPEAQTKARELVRQLGSQIYRDRDRATRELHQMGRLALTALYDGRADADPEIRNRAASLLPRAEAEDLRARVDTFLADTGGKFTHELPGWHPFKQIAGDDRLARSLFADIVRSPDNHELLIALRDAGDGSNPATVADLARVLVVRRQSIRHQEITQLPNGGMSIRQIIPEAADVALLLLSEILVPEKLAEPAPNQVSVMRNFFYQQQNKALLTGTGKYGQAYRKLTLGWLESRDGPQGTQDAMSLAQIMGLGQAEVNRYTARALEVGQPQHYVRANALTQLARNNGKEYVPLLIRFFDDEARLLFGANQPEIQLRDVALAMALLLTNQDPTDYGFGPPPRPNEAMRFSYNYHRFLPDEKQTADEKRTAAFARFRSWQAAVYGAAAGPVPIAAGFPSNDVTRASGK